MTTLTTIQNQIIEQGSQQKADWWQNYVKHDTRFVGTPMGIIRKIVTSDAGLQKMAAKEQLVVVKQLFSNQISEMKLAGVLILEHYLISKVPPHQLLEFIETLFKINYIYDWNVCDWLGVKVIAKLTNSLEEPDYDLLKNWSRAQNLWLARISLISFVKSDFDDKEVGQHIIEAAANLIQREERFAKTAVGWTLREFSKQKPATVREFITQYHKHFSAEALKQAKMYA